MDAYRDSGKEEAAIRLEEQLSLIHTRFQVALSVSILFIICILFIVFILIPISDSDSGSGSDSDRLSPSISGAVQQV